MQEYLVNRPDEATMERLLNIHTVDVAGVVLRLAWQVGLLRDEITNLTWDQVDFESFQIHLPDRTVPIGETLADYLRTVHKRWTFVIGDPANNYVVWSDRYHKQMQPQAISRIVRKALDEGGQTEVRLIDLRHDYVIRQLERYDWAYVARITGTEIRSLQLHFAQHLPDGKAGPKHIDKSDEIDEFRLWKILQAEKDTPAGLALWLTWSMGLSATTIVFLTWDQVDFDRNVLWLPEGDIPMTTAVSQLLKKRYKIRAGDPHVLLSAEAKRPLDIYRLSRIVRTALIRGGMETWTLRDLWLARGENRWSQAVLGKIKQDGPVTRKEVMELFGLSKYSAYQRLHRMVNKRLLIRVGCKYYLPGSVVPPEQQSETIYNYLKTEGFACRQDLADILHIGTKQCGILLKREVESGKLVRSAQRYYLKDSQSFTVASGSLYQIDSTQ